MCFVTGGSGTKKQPLRREAALRLFNYQPTGKEEMISSIILKYNLEKKQTVMIGDASTDMVAAKGAGVDGIGVLWGYGSNKNALIENANYIVKDVKELRECLK